MAKTVEVRLGERSYPIHVGRDLPLGEGLPDIDGARAMIVTDSHVEALHGMRVHAAFEKQGLSCFRMVLPAGEATKDLHWAGELYGRAARERLDRSGIMIALGGGVVGDLAGFVAATYLRGIRLVQVPTTLLAMVDSSVGGKTAINLPQGKNLVGVFHQPIAVFADLATLESLPEREYLSGLAEVVKYGVIWDAPLFHALETHADALRRRDPAALEPVVARCCEIKAEVVALDEKELGPRAILNFGHTLAHALEKVGGYGRWCHGEAVAIGMHYAVQVSVACHGLAKAEADRVTALLGRMGLPVTTGTDIPWEDLREAMLSDKKTLRQKPRFVLAKRLGDVVPGCEVPDQLLAEIWHVCSQ
jgi:3-dehydroquinate synthase